MSRFVIIRGYSRRYTEKAQAGIISRGSRAPGRLKIHESSISRILNETGIVDDWERLRLMIFAQ